MALESVGVIRADLMKGKTGIISAADAFNVVPLGGSPKDGSIGYPLVRAYLSLLEVRGVFEFSIALGSTNTDFHLGQAGVRYEYDATRPPISSAGDLLDPTKGQIMRILLDTDHSDGFEQFDTVIYDRDQGIGSPGQRYSVVTSSYIAEFAARVGASLKDAEGRPLPLLDAILHRPDGSEVKQVEAFMTYLRAAPGGKLPPLYDASSPDRTVRRVCLAGCPRSGG